MNEQVCTWKLIILNNSLVIPVKHIHNEKKHHYVHSSLSLFWSFQHSLNNQAFINNNEFFK